MTVFKQLTEEGAVVPYGICTDPNKDIWVAAKGGLFKFTQDGQECLFSEPNKNHKQIAAFCNVLCTNDKDGEARILVKFSDEHSVLCQLAVYDLNGKHISTTLIDEKVQGICASANGTIYMSTQPNYRKSQILRTNLEELSIQEPILTSTDYGFGQLCYISTSHTLAAAAVSLPISPYSEQQIQLINPGNGSTNSSLGSFGKEEGQIFHARSLQPTPTGDQLAVLDKLGRIQKFSLEKSTALDFYEGLIGKIPSNLANGFCFADSDRILVTCSGIVRDEPSGAATCSDWIECLSTLSADD